MSATLTDNPNVTAAAVASISERYAEPDWLKSEREAAYRAYESTPFPTERTEEWRYTQLKRFDFSGLELAKAPKDESISERIRMRIDDSDAEGVMVHKGNKVVYHQATIKEAGVVFTDLRTAEPISTVTWAGHEIDPAEARVAVAAGQGVADVRLFHPVFANFVAAGVEGERDVAHVGFMLLQLALGEEDFGLWLRSFAFAAEEPEGAMPLAELPGFIDRLAGACPRWLTLQGQADGKPVMVGTRAPLSPLVGPLFTRHVVAQLLFADVLDDGQAGEASAKALADFHEDAMATLADDGLLVATETADGMRLLHFYVDPETDATERLASLTDTWTEGDHEIVAAEDPAWERVGHLRA